MFPMSCTTGVETVRLSRKCRISLAANIPGRWKLGAGIEGEGEQQKHPLLAPGREERTTGKASDVQSRRIKVWCYLSLLSDRKQGLSLFGVPLIRWIKGAPTCKTPCLGGPLLGCSAKLVSGQPPGHNLLMSELAGCK